MVNEAVSPVLDRLLPDVRTLVLAAAATPFPVEVTTDAAVARRYLALGRAGLGREPVAEPEPVASVDDRTLPSGVAVRVYRPALEGALPALVFLHGGGWVLGNLEMHDETCRRLANRVPCVVVSVDYRLAPEHPFPAALDDVIEALGWVRANAVTLGVDDRVVVCGTSAGGNLAAAAALRSRDDGLPPVRAQVLLYPVLDSTMSSGSYDEFGDGPMLDRRQMAWYWDQYLGSAGRRDDPLASPAHATDLAGLPPAVVVVAECDVLRDEAEAYVVALRRAGVPVVARRLEGQVHSFLRQLGVVAAADRALDEIAAAIGSLVGAPRGTP